MAIAELYWEHKTLQWRRAEFWLHGLVRMFAQVKIAKISTS